MIRVVVYDISDDNRRNRVAAYLETQGFRVQKSVFECQLSDVELVGVCSQLARLIEETDSIRVYAICAGCEGKSIDIGTVKSAPNSEGFVIL